MYFRRSSVPIDFVVSAHANGRLVERCSISATMAGSNNNGNINITAAALALISMVMIGAGVYYHKKRRIVHGADKDETATNDETDVPTHFVELSGTLT